MPSPRHPACAFLNLLKNNILELPLDLLTLVIRTRFAVESHQGSEVELGLLQQLDLADVDLGGWLASRPRHFSGTDPVRPWEEKLTFWRG